MTVARSLVLEHQQKLDALRASEAADLDQAYLSTQVIAHQQAFGTFEVYFKDGPDGSSGSLVMRMLPDPRMHPTPVQALANK